MHSLLEFLVVALAFFSDIGEANTLTSKRSRPATRRPQFWGRSDDRKEALSPKLFIINMYESEGDTWLSKESLNLYANNVTVPGLSPLFPDVHCNESGDLCELITGEGEINAASTMTALAFSPLFNLTRTYFMLAGDAGVNPACGTTGGVAFSRYAVQVALQYELDPRDIPSNYTTGYIPQGSDGPNQYPNYIYGTEVFELNENLKDRAVQLASKANLSDNDLAKTYRAQYPHTEAASLAPAVFSGDTATSDVWFSGPTLGEAFANFTTLVTNGTAKYCMSAQEDNASLEALLRADLAGRADFSRIILMRTASDFDRPPPGVSSVQNLIYEDSGGYPPSLENMYRAGMEIVKDIRQHWNDTYENGIKADNYIGDIYDSLNSAIKPDFGNPADYGNGSLANG